MTLSCRGLTLGYGARDVVSDLAITIPAGQMTTLIGPNGCGKSTLLRGLAGLLKPRLGIALLDGKSLASWPRRQLATRLAFLSQTQTAPEGLTVVELVRHGRFPHRALFDRERPSDRAAVEWALSATGLEPLAGRLLTALSGGERQRVWIAMALAQQADILLLDEPTTYLDLHHQLEIMQLLTELNATHCITLVMSVHDLNHAMRYSHHTVVMDSGRIVAQGKPADIIEPDMLRRVFRVKTAIFDHPGIGLPVCYPEQALPAHTPAAAVPQDKYYEETSLI